MTDPSPARAVALSIARARLRQDVEPWETARATADADPTEVAVELREIADALTAGRLLPADAETRTEWSVRVTSPDGEITMSSSGIVALLDRDIAERSATNIRGRTNVVKAEAVSRFAATGPWLPAPTTEES